ncbi:type VI secretion system protein TssA, partial [Escherichia coli]|uniref:type VI secretion system ImpA family N-terminal domain-containing protein n=1 Tax=Escherichia coli TaxID=562 RepID=UPI0010269055
MSELLQKLTRSCFADRDALDVARTQAALWQTWLLPVTADTPVGEDPGYHDDFLRIRDEMNKLSGADTGLICQLAESLLLTQAKDVRIATSYIWARLHRDGERALADVRGLVAGRAGRFVEILLPSPPASRQMASVLLAGAKMRGTLARYPHAAKAAVDACSTALDTLCGP